MGDIDVSSLGSQLGVINALRTGNPLLDMLIVMMIPFAFQILTAFGGQARPFFDRFLLFFSTASDVITRTIEFEFRTTAWGSVIRSNGKEERNNILQKAIILFIGEMKHIKMNSAKVSLMAVTEKGNRDQDTYEMVYGSTADQLKQYDINVLPPCNVWIELRPDLNFMITNNEEDGDGEGGNRNSGNTVRKNVTMYHFKVPRSSGESVIDGFLKEAFNWYVDRVRASQDNGRYLYMLVKGGAASSKENDEEGGGESSNNRIYKRYKLSDEKNFECLFFRERAMLLKLLDHFKHKTGKYAIRGFPHKLGLLLHGPPGTGKTSLIKALASHTGRNVVSIPLSRIETNQELMDIVFDQAFAVKGEDMPIKLSFKDIIFVMEDVDAASPIVHARSDGNGSSKSDDGSKSQKKLTNQVSTSGAEHTSDSSADVIVQSDLDAAPALLPAAPGEDSDLVKAMLLSLSDDSDSKKKSSKYLFSSSSSDRLDLSGLLNVLDGVVDCPNRILVMTTNHPEKLDPALIRPGRIDKIIYLGYMQAPEAKMMVQHYFQCEMTEQQYSRLEACLAVPLKSSLPAIKMYGDRGFTPAELEQLCAEYDSVDDFLHNLENRVLEESRAVAPPEVARSPTRADSSATVASLARNVSLSRQTSVAKATGSSHSVHADAPLPPAPVPLRRGLSQD